MSFKKILKNARVWRSATLFLASILLIFNVFFQISFTPRWGNVTDADFETDLFPAGGTELPISWNDLGQKLTETGVIDREKLVAIYTQRGGLDDYGKNLLDASVSSRMRVTRENAGLLLNLFWALGLANKNLILDQGPMQNPRYGGAGNFASTGGWTIAKGDAMEHYSKHDFIALTAEQQSLVEKISKGIYRPCCNNSTYFPDCNHGMAMLGFLELMAAQGASEEEMYRGAVALNTYWFPSQYLTLAKYFETEEGVAWKKADPRKVLGADFSSGSGYARVLAKVQPVQSKGGGACGV